MFVVCNRISINQGHEKEFEDLFLSRDPRQAKHPITEQPGFIRNDLLRPTQEEPYVVLTYWSSREDFEAWTNSESFKEAHSGRSRQEIFAGRPNLEIHEVIRSVIGSGAGAELIPTG